MKWFRLSTDGSNRSPPTAAADSRGAKRLDQSVRRMFVSFGVTALWLVECWRCWPIGEEETPEAEQRRHTGRFPLFWWYKQKHCFDSSLTAALSVLFIILTLHWTNQSTLICYKTIKNLLILYESVLWQLRWDQDSTCQVFTQCHNIPEMIFKKSETSSDSCCPSAEQTRVERFVKPRPPAPPEQP